MSNWTQFFRQIRREFQTTGAVAPSGRFLAKAITRPFMEHDGPRRVLEIGPGTGAFTKRVAKHLRPDDHFDIVEINAEFADHIREQFRSDDDYLPAAEQSRVHCVPLQDFVRPDSGEPYDVVISGLPLNNFPAPLVTELVDAALSHVRPGGTFSMFEYMYVRPIRTRVGTKSDRERMKAIEAIMQERFDRYRFDTDWVFPNILPAWVQHLRIDETDGPTNSVSAPSEPEAIPSSPQMSV